MYVLCFTRPRYQVSVYRTIGPLVYFQISILNILNCLTILFLWDWHSVSHCRRVNKGADHAKWMARLLIGSSHKLGLVAPNIFGLIKLLVGQVG